MFTHRCTTKQSRKGYVNLVDSHSFICVVCNAYNNFKCFKQLCLDAQLEEKKNVCVERYKEITENIPTTKVHI